MAGRSSSIFFYGGLAANLPRTICLRIIMLRRALMLVRTTTQNDLAAQLR
jgi:hypothetical protein